MSAQEVAKDNRIIAVLGSGRSGTSLLMQLLAAQGLSVATPLPADVSNTLGNFEDSEIVALHEEIGRLLRLSPISAKTLTKVDESRIEAQKSALQAIVKRKVEAGGRWGFKDPRASLFVPFWDTLLGELGLSASYVLCMRDPSAVVGSMKRQYSSTDEVAELRWLVRTIEPIVATHGNIFVVHYEDWFGPKDKCLRTAEDLVDFLSLPKAGLEQNFDRVVKETLNRTAPSIIVNPDVKRLYKALKKCAGKPTDMAVNLALELKISNERFSTAAQEFYGRELNRALTRANRASEAQLSGLNAKLQKLNEDFAQSQRDAELRLSEAQAKHAADAEQLKSAQLRERARFERHSKEATEAHAGEIERLKETHANEVGRLKEAQEGEIARLEQARAAEIEQLSQRIQELESEIASARQTHEQELARERAGGAAAAQKAQAKISDISKQLEDLVEVNRVQSIELKRSAADFERLRVQVFSLIGEKKAKDRVPPTPVRKEATEPASAFQRLQHIFRMRT